MKNVNNANQWTQKAGEQDNSNVSNVSVHQHSQSWDRTVTWLHSTVPVVSCSVLAFTMWVTSGYCGLGWHSLAACLPGKSYWSRVKWGHPSDTSHHYTLYYVILQHKCVIIWYIVDQLNIYHNFAYSLDEEDSLKASCTKLDYEWSYWCFTLTLNSPWITICSWISHQHNINKLSEKIVIKYKYDDIIILILKATWTNWLSEWRLDSARQILN